MNSIYRVERLSPVLEKQMGISLGKEKEKGLFGIELCPPKFYVKVLTPVTSEYDYIWRQGL